MIRAPWKGMDMEASAALLSNSPLFSGLSAAHREQIAPHLTRHDFAPNAEIVKQGEVGDSLYLLESGTIGVFRRDPHLGIVQMIANFPSSRVPRRSDAAANIPVTICSPAALASLIPAPPNPSKRPPSYCV